MLKLVIILFVFMPVFLCGQSTPWSELAHNCNETPFILKHISANDHMVATIPGINKSYISMNHGQSWKDFLTGITRFSKVIQTEASEDLYFADNYKIYKYESTTDNTEPIHDNEAYGVIEDGLILANGHKLIIDKKDRIATIRYFNMEGQLITSNELTGQVSYINLHFQDGYPTYVSLSYWGGSSKKVHELDMNDLSLSYLSDIAFHTSGIHYLNGRLFSSNLFSDDGGTTWQNISTSEPVQYTNSMAIQDSLVVMLSPDHVLISEDYGEFFTAIPQDLDLSFGQRVSINNAGKRIFLYNEKNNFSYQSYYSDDRGVSWTRFHNAFDLPHLTGLSISTDDRAVVNSINCGRQYHFNADWAEINNMTNGNYLHSFRALPNGNFVGINPSTIFLSGDHGANWSSVIAKFYESREVIVKEELVYIPRYQELAVSSTNGITYTVYPTPPMYARDSYDCFSTLKILNYNFDDELNIYDVINESSELIGKTKNPALHLDLATDWSGTGFHILEYKDDTKSQLIVQNSEGAGFAFTTSEIQFMPEGTDFNISTDHNGNIIINSTKQVIISQDDGVSWINITPDRMEDWQTTDLSISYDHYLYLSTLGTDILKFPCPLNIDIRTCPDFVSGVSETAATDINVYPNPTTIRIFISVAGTSNYQVKLYHLNGQLLKSFFNAQSINLASVPMGTYLLEIKNLTTGYKKTERIVKIK